MTLTVPRWQSLKTRVTLITLAIFLLSLWSLSFYASQMLRKDMGHLLGEQQFSTVSVVADSINADLNDRINALKLVARTLDSSMLENPATLQKFLDQLIVVQTDFNAGVHVVGRDGVTLADVSDAHRVGTSHADNEAVHAALSEGKTTIGQPLMEPMLKQPALVMVTPIFDGQGKVIGALIGTTNLGQPNFLDKVSGNRYGKTGGYILVAPRHRLVVTATDKSRIMEALPAPGINLLADRLIQGAEGSALFVDQFGVEVLSSTKLIPVSGWGLSAVLPAAEAFAPLHAMQRRMLLATFLLTVLAGVLTWWTLRRQLAPMLAAARTLVSMSNSNQPAQRLPIARQDEIGQLIGGFNRLLTSLGQQESALRKSEAQNRALISAIPDFIFTNRRDGEYLAVHATDPALLYVSPQTFLHRKIGEVLPKPLADRFMQTFAQALDSNSILELDYSLAMGGHERQFEARIVPATQDTVISIVRDVTERKRAEAALRIAAIAFECQEGIVVMDADLNVLRVNRAFTQITGYSQQEAQLTATGFIRSERDPASFYDAVWRETSRTGAWQGDVWHRRKNGEDYSARLTVTAVTDETGQITHYVSNLTDNTSSRLQEQQRLQQEAAHRETLVREVHHRIKNNLQGITGILRQFAQQHPETAEPINQAIGQVQGISVIHGLQGRAVTSSVRLCELTGAIADEIKGLWRTPLALDIPTAWLPCVIAENEAVPIALVLNELILNAVKHGGQAQGNVSITLRKGLRPDIVQVTIRNAGQLPRDDVQTGAHRSGLQLIAALMPRQGARLVREQHGDQVVTLLELAPPVISLDQKEPA